MEHKTNEQLQTYMAQNSDSVQEHARITECVGLLLQKKYDQNLLNSYIQLNGKLDSQLDLVSKLKICEIYSLYHKQIQQNSNFYESAQQNINQLLLTTLQNIITRIDAVTMNFLVPLKLLKQILAVVVQYNTKCDSAEYQNKLQQFIQALFLPQYFKHEQTRMIIIQLSCIYGGCVEKCLLALHVFQNKQTYTTQFLQELLKHNQSLIMHILNQIVKIKNKTMFLQLFKYYSPLNQIQNIFTQFIQQKINSPNQFVKRNVLLILETVFPSSTLQLEISAELQLLTRQLQDQYVMVRCHALQAAQIVLQKYFTQLQPAQTQLLFDQLIISCFDSNQQCRNKSIQIIIQLFQEAEIKPNIMKIISSNFQQFKQLLNIDNTNKKTRQLTIQLFCLIQQEQHLLKTNTQKELFSSEFQSFLLSQLNSLNQLDSMFPNQLQTFVENPQFCYEQIYLSSNICKDFLNKCLDQLLEQTDSSIFQLSKYYLFLKTTCTEKEDVKLEELNLLLNNKHLTKYINEQFNSDLLMCCASLVHISFQILQINPTINMHLFKIITQILNLYIFYKCIQLNAHNQQKLNECLQFSLQSLNKDFQSKIFNSSDTIIQIFGFHISYIIQLFNQEKTIKKLYFTNEHQIKSISNLQLMNVCQLNNYDLINELKYNNILQNEQNNLLGNGYNLFITNKQIQQLDVIISQSEHDFVIKILKTFKNCLIETKQIYKNQIDHENVDTNYYYQLIVCLEDQLVQLNEQNSGFDEQKLTQLINEMSNIITNIDLQNLVNENMFKNIVQLLVDILYLNIQQQNLAFEQLKQLIVVKIQDIVDQIQTSNNTETKIQIIRAGFEKLIPSLLQQLDSQDQQQQLLKKCILSSTNNGSDNEDDYTNPNINLKKQLDNNSNSTTKDSIQ